MGNAPNVEEIQRKCETNEQFLKKLVKGDYSFLYNYLQGDLIFGVARRWNSWYPSFFNVKGGCYVLIPGDNKEENIKNGVVVIDPGFNFIEILKEIYQIEPQAITTVIVTHFHPDHMIGLLEYTTIMKTSGQQCDIYLNETTYTAFKSLNDKFISIHELRDGQIQELMCYATKHNDFLKISFKAKSVHHNEIGNQHRSLGIILEIVRFNNKAKDNETYTYRVGILGDTDGNNNYIHDYIKDFGDTDILVLHLGTFSNKNYGQGGKHLYIEGVKNILRQMNNDNPSKKSTIVLSEFGLELADKYTLYHNIQPFIESHFWRLPIIYAKEYIKEKCTCSEINDEKDHLHFFARATLSILDRIYKPVESISLSHKELTKKEKEELLIAVGYQILVFNMNNDAVECFRNNIIELYSKISFEIKSKEKNEIRKVNKSEYLSLLDKSYSIFNNVIDDYNRMIEIADFTSESLPKHHLIESCSILIDDIVINLNNPMNVLYYIDKIDYIKKYTFNKDIEGNEKFKWLIYNNNNTVSNLNLFWTVCLLGVFILKKQLEKYEPKTNKSMSDTLLLKIRDYFQSDVNTKGNVLIGDIGCTFGIDPLIRDGSDTRKIGIKLKSCNGEWISPESALCKYDNTNERLCYYEED